MCVYVYNHMISILVQFNIVITETECLACKPLGPGTGPSDQPLGGHRPDTVHLPPVRPRRFGQFHESQAGMVKNNG